MFKDKCKYKHDQSLRNKRLKERDANSHTNAGGKPKGKAPWNKNGNKSDANVVQSTQPTVTSAVGQPVLRLPTQVFHH